MAKTILTAAIVRELLSYDAETGAFTWKKEGDGYQRFVGGRVGRVAGCMHNKGYLQIRIGQVYLAHRLAWLYVTGRWPEKTIDHIDGNKLNNAFGNLRDVSSQENAQNLRRPLRTNKLGCQGVSKHGIKYRASITANGKRVHIGSFGNAEDAHTAYLAAKREMHRGCTI